MSDKNFVSYGDAETILTEIAADNASIKNDVDVLKSDVDYNLLEISAETQTINGVTFTVNRNEAGQVTSIVANGTATENVYFLLFPFEHIENYKGYFLSCCPSGGSYSNKWFVIIQQPITLSQLSVPDTGEGTYILVNSENDNYTGFCNSFICIRANVVCSNLTFYPMITKPEYAGLPFKPYVPPYLPYNGDTRGTDTFKMVRNSMRFGVDDVAELEDTDVIEISNGDGVYIGNHNGVCVDVGYENTAGLLIQDSLGNRIGLGEQSDTGVGISVDINPAEPFVMRAYEYNNTTGASIGFNLCHGSNATAHLELVDYRVKAGAEDGVLLQNDNGVSVRCGFGPDRNHTDCLILTDSGRSEIMLNGGDGVFSESGLLLKTNNNYKAYYAHSTTVTSANEIATVGDVSDLLSTVKAVVSQSTSFEDFKTRIAAL